jgi:hypothetical protein
MRNDGVGVMSEVEVGLVTGVDWERVVAVVEGCCAAEGLQISQKGILTRYPGCTHWHYRRPGQSGTLEITCWPERGRLWFPIRAGRSNEWVEAAVLRLKDMIEETVAG